MCVFRKAKRSGSNIFAMFSQRQIQEFKEAFGIIDNDKDGIITAPDLKKAFEVSFEDIKSFINVKFHLNWCITIDLVFPDYMETMVCLLCQRKSHFLGHLLAHLLDKGTKSNGTLPHNRLLRRSLPLTKKYFVLPRQ